jgi:beta-glucosidase-like glycosyl hydrolase/CubicO group peptidase (beta-lactamase class C family)
MGRDIAKQMRRLGVHINFAPVVDVNNNPDNPVIGSRSFGEDRFNVAQKGIAYMNGMQDNYVMSVAKHFPGHGDTDQDSHKTLPVIPHDTIRLDSLELFPFKRMIQNGVGGVMVAHLQVPAYNTVSGRPATLSENVVTRLLREKMNFNGLIFTDALNMKGVTRDFAPGQIEVEALKAGNDVLLYPQDVSKAISQIKSQVRKGQIERSAIEESCRRIISFKYWSGMDTIEYSRSKSEEMNLVEKEDIIKDLNKPEYQVLNRKLKENALTLLDSSRFFPLEMLDTISMASVALGAKDKTPFQQTIDLYGNCDHYIFKQGDDPSVLLRKLMDYDVVLASVHGTNQRPYRKYGLSTQYFPFLRKLSGLNNAMLFHFGNPYALKYFDYLENYEAILNGYDDDSLTQDLAAQALFGAFNINGRLPVTVTDSLPLGTGAKNNRLDRFKYTLPEAVGVNSEKLQVVDSIIHSAIDSQAIPGCQVLAARHGKVFYHKMYGYHTYLKEKPVKWNDIYDLASITKIAASVPSIMHLYDQGMLSLDSTLDTYLPYLDTTNKGDLVLKDILTHQARLKPWIPFYYKTIKSLYPGQELLDSEFSEEYPYKLGKNAFVAKNFQYKEGIYSRNPSDSFSIEVADNLYMKNVYIDSIFRWIDESELLERKRYVYSDLGYYYLYKIIEKLTAQELENFVKSRFYDRLGAYLTGFRPLDYLPAERIVPTENDMVFRRQLLQGYVHDPGTAMMGGVCGHAGLFANANDLAKIMQMYLNNGYYGGHRFFRESTLNLFTHSPFKESNDNRRAIGFDKPVKEEDKSSPAYKEISTESFGHSGFTGTLAWADPDKDLVYVFLSNRVHPDQDNIKLITKDIRTKIQKAIYEAIEN